MDGPEMMERTVKHALIMPSGLIGDNVQSVIDYAVADGRVRLGRLLSV